ncbi:MAG: hypothetical protein QOJ27_1919 [Sphingomonadales bacterium]|nr:hypothetical protein [Sphingomonadales bacterium]
MRLPLVALALALPVASAAEAPAARPAAKAAVPARLCSDALRARDARSPAAAQLRRLGELPPGDLTLTVVHQIGDCIEPLVVRQGIGAVR